jgi:uncharacterized membrane protein
MIRGFLSMIAMPIAALAVSQARAELTLCNRTSFRVEAAIGLEKRANVATRGWFRLDPGQCRLVIDGPLDAEMVYLHARTPSVYGTAPRRLAGIQRLLVIAGYDAYPIDGVQGAKTQAAITKFLNDRKLPPDTAAAPNFFETLIEAARNPEGIGFTWCNDTRYAVWLRWASLRWERLSPAAGIASRPANVCDRICATTRIDSIATRRQSTATAAQSSAAMRRWPGAVPSPCARATDASSLPITRIAQHAV